MRQEKADSARRDLKYVTKSLQLKSQRAVEFMKEKGASSWLSGVDLPDGRRMKSVEEDGYTCKYLGIREYSEVLHAEMKTWGQFYKTFTRVIYKCIYCSQTLKQWLQL